ncbi:MAG: hypothetical protein WCH99_15760 [Verrucomicrobiota bacterium]
MGFHIKITDGMPIVETSYLGNLSAAELAEAIAGSLALAKKHRLHHFLGDCQELLGGHSVLDLFSKLEQIIQEADFLSVKEALILPTCPEAAENVRFWETACRNRGMDVQTFVDRESAVKWLLQES